MMPYKPITIDRDNLSIMGVQFPDLETLNSAADAIGTNMFEGYEPAPQGIAIIRDYLLDKITLDDVIKLAKAKKYA
ncbi:MAG: antitoxin VbhA family protein [Treponema sp.]|jgi:putative transcriptional regulator|nr:antitoxin VbhA family protein [Treponema sp.]